MNQPTTQDYAPFALVPHDFLTLTIEHNFGIKTIKVYLYLLFRSQDGTVDLNIDLISATLKIQRKDVWYSLADLDATDLIITRDTQIIIPDFFAWTTGVKP